MMADQLDNATEAQDSVELLLEKLVANAEDLKQALISRRSEAIFSVVSEQEELMRRLEAAENSGDSGAALPEGKEQRRKLGALAVRVRGLQRTNSRLAMAFLDTVDRTMNFLQQSVNPRAGTYDASGGSTAGAGPILVHQRG